MISINRIPRKLASLEKQFDKLLPKAFVAKAKIIGLSDRLIRRAEKYSIKG